MTGCVEGWVVCGWGCYHDELGHNAEVRVFLPYRLLGTFVSRDFNTRRFAAVNAITEICKEATKWLSCLDVDSDRMQISVFS